MATSIDTAIDQSPRQGESEFTFEFKTVPAKPKAADNLHSAALQAFVTGSVGRPFEFRSSPSR